MLQKKLQALSRIIFELTEIPLFIEMPSGELNSLDVAVTDEDSLRARVADICNLLDRLNKREIDRFTGVSTKGSRKCFICLLKKLLPNEHNSIDKHIEFPLGMILLLRGFLTHRKNKGIKRALEFFEIKPPIQYHQTLWEKVLFHFNETIDHSIEILNFDASKKDFRQDEIDDQLRIVLEEKLIRRYSYLFEEDNVKSLLLYIMSKGTAIDAELSRLFKLDISELRESLLPLVPNILRISYYDSEFTKITINDYALEILKDFYFKEASE